MRAYLFQTGRLIEPFMDPPERVPILDESLASQRRRVLKDGAGIEELEPVEAPVEIGSEPALVLFDHLYCSRRTIRDFVRQAEGLKGRAAVLALPKGPLTEFAGPLQDRLVEGAAGAERVLFDAFVVRDTALDPTEDAKALRQRLLEGAERLTLEPRVDAQHQRWPSIQGEKLGIDLPRSLWGAAHLGHWVHLLWLNRQAIETQLLEMSDAEAEQGRTFLHAGREYERYSRRGKPPVYVGENCAIHPSVMLENVVLGDNVNIDLRSMLRSSVLGDGVSLAAATDLVGCVLAAGCHTLSSTCVLESVFMRHASLSNLKLQHTIAGQEAFITGGVMFSELGLDGDIQVELDGRWVDSGRRILGGCVGHRCVLGARAVFLGGRAVPNDYMVVLKPGEGLSKIPGGLDARWAYTHGGRLEPIGDLDPGWDPAEW